jgi:hypothetical protein
MLYNDNFLCLKVGSNGMVTKYMNASKKLELLAPAGLPLPAGRQASKPKHMQKIFIYEKSF